MNATIEPTISKTKQNALNAYVAAHRRALAALAAVEAAIQDSPAPDGEIDINWAHVGTMNSIAANLEEIAL